MARPREFDKDQALGAAIGVFREHGYAGTSADMLVQAMGIGRQSMYDTFGDKWTLYCSSLQRYIATEAQAHIAALRSKRRAIDGIRAMIDGVVGRANEACLGTNSICEFGHTRPDLAEIHNSSGHAIHAAFVTCVREAQAQGDVAADLDPREVADFLIANIAGIRIAARAGADALRLRALGQLALRALR